MHRWLLILLACTQLAWAQTPTPMPVPNGLDALKTKLALTDDQVKKIEATLENVRKTLQGKAERMAKLEREIAAMQHDRSKKDAVVAKIRESEQIRFAMLYIDLVGSRKIETLLTPEQLQKIRELQVNRR